MTRLSCLLVVFPLVFSLACHKHTPTHTELELEKRVHNTEQDLASIEEKLKNAKNDEGLEIQLKHERDLAKARLDRFKLALTQEKAAHKD